ncbi:transposase domain-containing protein [Streptacidiphilus rugosus]|uniref:transposase domain-containing protein n=1 Tax=Streptacidiphilus rugosus TaxID=405783 RepID=UPI000A9CB2EA|nr:transposase domain-containing protein [Streptacidiphilus rugosus]
MAAGPFGPGRLGELTQVVPFELVDAVLEGSGCVQRRLQDLPSRVGVYFLLAMCLFPEVGYRLVWNNLTAALTSSGLDVAGSTAKALRDLRRRFGAVPVRRLFEVLAGPLARPATAGVRFGRFRTVSFDGCSSIRLADTARNVGWFGPGGRGGCPMLELMTLVETGTRSLIGAVFGPTDTVPLAGLPVRRTTGRRPPRPQRHHHRPHRHRPRTPPRPAAITYRLPRRPERLPRPAPTAPHPRTPATGPDALLETRGDRRPLRRRHPAHHVSAAVPMSRNRDHPQTRTRPLRSHQRTSTPMPPAETR